MCALARANERRKGARRVRVHACLPTCTCAWKCELVYAPIGTISLSALECEPRCTSSLFRGSVRVQASPPGLRARRGCTAAQACTVRARVGATAAAQRGAADERKSTTEGRECASECGVRVRVHVRVRVSARARASISLRISSASTCRCTLFLQPEARAAQEAPKGSFEAEGAKRSRGSAFEGAECNRAGTDEQLEIYKCEEGQQDGLQ
eukprot:6060043-Pleurochrysis_carterae.AAC.3